MPAFVSMPIPDLSRTSKRTFPVLLVQTQTESLAWYATSNGSKSIKEVASVLQVQLSQKTELDQ